MIVRETLIINNKVFIKTYSDTTKHIKQLPTNRIYPEAIDVENANYSYVEVSEEEYQEYLKKTHHILMRKQTRL